MSGGVAQVNVPSPSERRNCDVVPLPDTFSSDTPTALVEESQVCQTFGLNYYPNDWTRIQLNYIYAAESPSEINNDALLIQVQVRF